jgi:hypothetical protein
MGADEQQSGAGGQLVSRQPAHDFSLVLLKTIDSVKNDPAQFRNLIYEMARVQLQKEAWHRNPPMNILELRRMMLALETAIERVETVSAQRDAMPMLAAGSAVIANSGPDQVLSRHTPIEVIDPPRVAEAFAWPTDAATAPQKRRVGRMPAPLKALVRFGVLAGVAAAAAVAVVIADREFHVIGTKPSITDKGSMAPVRQTASAESNIADSQGQSAPPARIASPAQPAIQSPAPALAAQSPSLLPSVYGVYAVSGGQLFELEALPGRVPDQRVFMSAIVKTPSHTVLPDGEVTFIVYRRDVASNAPDRVAVRVIAKVMHALTFNKAGQPNTVNVDDAWAVRNVTFDYRVAPANESPEMIVIKPDKDGFALPPGRYGLVIKGLAYDFTVNGRISATTQCLERTEAANGTFYSECRSL